MIEWLLFYKFNIEKIMWFEFYFILLSTWSNRWKVLFQGIWVGMILGTVLQTIILVYIIYKTNWNKEVSLTVFVFFLKRKDYNNLEFGQKKSDRGLLWSKIFRLNKHQKEWSNGLDKIQRWVKCRKQEDSNHSMFLCILISDKVVHLLARVKLYS